MEGRQLMTITSPSIAGPWTQVFADDFNTLNTNVWTNGREWGNTDTAANGVFTPNNATASNGDLTLSAEWQNTVGTDGKTYPVDTGLIQSGGIQGLTTPGFEFEYGYVDVRMKCNSGTGLWAAAYMLPVSHQDGYEIDLVENVPAQPSTYYGGYHEWRDGNGSWGSTPLSFNGQQGYHDYAVDWEPGSLKFYVDGTLVRSYTGSDVPSQPMYLILNLDAQSYAGPNNTPGATDSASVDSVSVSQHTPDYFLDGQGVGALANPAAGQFGNASFEQENVHGDNAASDVYHPSDAYWTFNDESGVEANGSALNAANAPNGTQAGFVEGQPGGDALGQIIQTVDVPTAGTYNISFEACSKPVPASNRSP